MLRETAQSSDFQPAGNEAFVLFDVRGLFVSKRSEVGFCSVVLVGPLA